MTINQPITDTALLRSNLLVMLHSREVSVRFRKKDGDMRTMRCTLNRELVPTQTATESVREFQGSNPKLITAWDLDVAGWRSFRLDSLREVN